MHAPSIRFTNDRAHGATFDGDVTKQRVRCVGDCHRPPESIVCRAGSRTCSKGAPVEQQNGVAQMNTPAIGDRRPRAAATTLNNHTLRQRRGAVSQHRQGTSAGSDAIADASTFHRQVATDLDQQTTALSIDCAP